MVSRAKRDFHRQRLDQRLGDQPLQERYAAQMRAVAEAIDDLFNGGLQPAHKTTGFVLLVFPFGDDPASRCNFISNGGDRRDIVTLFRAMIARFEGQPEQSGRA